MEEACCLGIYKANVMDEKLGAVLRGWLWCRIAWFDEISLLCDLLFRLRIDDCDFL